MKSMSSRLMFLIGVGVVCAVAVVWWFSMRRDNQAVNAGESMGDFHRVTSQALEHEIRDSLPLGSSPDAVEAFLKKRGIEHSYDKSSRTLYATARKLKGSTIITTESLTLRFYFDEASSLKSIDAKVNYTGP